MLQAIFVVKVVNGFLEMNVFHTLEMSSNQFLTSIDLNLIGTLI
jgi:hypothetical protein